MTTNNIIVLCAFIAYMIIMIVIGFVCSKGNKNNEDYFLGGRNLGSWTAAMSAQASDMSGWLLMGLPGAVYLAGTGEAWIAIGLLIGTILNWYIVSARLRKYTIVAGNSLTIPSFFKIATVTIKHNQDCFGINHRSFLHGLHSVGIQFGCKAFCNTLLGQRKR